ncbi:3-hydroxyisobutyrate dehydrogenase [Oricola cellulosilytica]|uniref:3-hydroxyisobutyrate dehydrogenase n=1 Tax=Oricola cellulosilytica TaxID=1429082 RepID=A0A4R0PDT5_9HYPH|nr:3-hydroxyisobutyrate dehydrogenase [Oricola cellulosilytica]TCD14913.1 3-hydroxyisobutyrate dehydrogenase [Oricola cellulosilytica]
MNIGFIGLGNMGLPMAKNLAAAGHRVTGFDVVPAAREAATEAGIAIAAGNSEAATDADVVITMLPNGAIAKAVASEVLPAMSKGALLIDCSTVDVNSAREIDALASEQGVLCLDAPVSGGVGGAEAGTLTFMVGGSGGAFAKGAPFFDIMGKKAVHCGEGGAGQAAKICNNMLLGISMIGACEAFALAKKLGLSQERLFDVISTSSGSCWSVNTYCPVPGVGPKSPADNDYRPGFAAALMLKDLGLSQQAADAADAPTPLGRHAADLYSAMNDAGMGGDDFSAMIRFLGTMERKS